MQQYSISDDTVHSNDKGIILGCCSTGAKFTPKNHKLTGDRLIDTICCGDLVPVTSSSIRAELEHLFSGGCRYWHIHARNPVTREQSCDSGIYSAYGYLAQQTCPEMLLSYGASRNGSEITEAVKESGEWQRISHISLTRHAGGAHFVTAQAAIELQIVCDLERQGFVQFDHQAGAFEVLKPLVEFLPDTREHQVQFAVNSTSGGGNYGISSSRIQFDLLKRAVSERIRLNLPFEVEWVQNARSHFLTWFLIHHLAPEISQVKRINITLLFGFSPKLPVPKNYGEFRRVVSQAKSIAKGHSCEADIDVSVSVGAAVLPQHAAAETTLMDVGPLMNTCLSPLDRIISYAAQPDSQVDIIRVGLEDTPYFMDPAGAILPTTNVQLVQHASRMIKLNDAVLVLNPNSISNFASTGSLVAAA